MTNLKDESYNPAAYPNTRKGFTDDEPQPGMSLLDYFAGQALQGMLSNGYMPNQINNNPSDPKSWDYIAAAYDAAEIMLEERNKRLNQENKQ